MEENSYVITAGWAPNSVRDAAMAYLDAAEVIYKRECEKIGFFAINDWYVVHHLSVIAAELFMKSFRVVVTHSAVFDESGPEEESVEHAYNGHHLQLDRLEENDRNELKRHLSEEQFSLLCSITDRNLALCEIARGRYPYEIKERETRFSSGEDGRNTAEIWLSLARALSKFKKL